MIAMFDLSNAIYLDTNSIISQDKTTRKIEVFAQLDNGWDYGAGVPPSRDVILAAVAWSQRLCDLGFERTNASVASSGEISVTGSLGLYYVEIIVELDSTVSLALEEDRTQVFYDLRLAPLVAGKRLTEIAEKA